MKKYSEMLSHIESSDYENHFWNAVRGKQGPKEFMDKGVDADTGAFTLTSKGQDKYMAAVKKEGLFRSIATDICAYDHPYNIKTANGDDVAVWVPEGGTIPIAFGDLSYYWIVGRCPVSIRTLVEQFAMVDCIGYLAYEFLDGKLVRPEAIKVMEMTA